MRGGGDLGEFTLSDSFQRRLMETYLGSQRLVSVGTANVLLVHGLL